MSSTAWVERENATLQRLTGVWVVDVVYRYEAGIDEGLVDVCLTESDAKAAAEEFAGNADLPVGNDGKSYAYVDYWFCEFYAGKNQ